MESRLQGADFIRALACLMVLAHHLMQRLAPVAIPNGAVREVVSWGLMGSFGVSAFFVLSGFLLSRPFWQAYDAGAAMPSLRIYATRRAARIVPGFWLALTVSFILSFTLFGIDLDQTLVVRYLAGLFLVSELHYITLFPVEFNGPLWSIGFEVGSYVLLPLCLALVFLLRPFARKSWGGRIVWIAILGGVVGLHLLIMRVWPIDNEMRGWEHGFVGGAKEWMPRFNVIGFFVIFAIGALAGSVQVRFARIKSWGFDAAVVAGLALAIWSVAPHVRTGIPEGWGLYSIPYGFAWFPAAVAIVLAAAPSSRFLSLLLDNSPTRYVARISFGIYVWHYLLIEVIREVWYEPYHYQGVMNFSHWLLLGAVVTGVSLLIAHISYYVLEAPIIAWARTLERRRPPELEPAPAARPGF
jgi:peptidoglycan/LPS O-acetylase OafA/YrhL